MNIKTEHFDWAGELEKNVVHSLATSFGLDFLLFEDKRGGDVDTIHKVREYQKELKKGNTDIYVSDNFKQLVRTQEEYNSVEYHSGESYISTNRQKSIKHKEGILADSYTGELFSAQDGVDLDHVVSAYEIHNDYGRILSGISGESLANSEYNLKPTHYAINRSKREMSIEDLIDKVPMKIVEKEKYLARKREELSSAKESKDINRIEKLEKEIKNAEVYIEQHELLKNQESKVLEIDKNARTSMDKEINTFYTSKEFIQDTAMSAGLSGLKMGTRQALGLVIAEVWFEIKELIPSLLLKYKYNFEFSLLLEDLKKSLSNIFERVKKRFSEILIVFRDAGLSGIMSSLTSTLINIVATTSKLAGKLIREMWSPLIQVAKLIFFNPENLSLGELTKNVLKILGGAAAVFLGSILHAELNSLLAFPFGSDIAAFISALVTGIITLLISYFLEHSELMQKVWGALDNFFKDKYDLQLEEFQRLNRELDNTLLEIAKIELSFDVDELKVFNDSLLASSCEYEKSKLIKLELDKKGIDMPYEFGNTNSMVDWLVGLRK